MAEPADDVIPELVVKEGEDIDYRVVLAAYLLADLGGLVESTFCNETYFRKYSKT
jgi:hypothetical protein